MLAAINHQEPDRVPVGVGISNATGIKIKTYRELRHLLGVDPPDQYIYDWSELGTAKIDEAVLERMHVDVRAVLDVDPDGLRQKNKNRSLREPYVKSWGVSQYELAPVCGLLANRR